MSKKPAKKKSSALGPRAVPPKRTGKSNLTLKNALDDDKDFDKPVRGDGTGTPETAPSTPAAAKETGSSLMVEQPPKPTVVGDRIQMQYLKPSFSKTTKGERLLAMHMTFALTKEHTKDSLLPKAVRDGWTIMSKHGRKRFDIEVPGQKAVFYLTPDGDDDKLILPAAKVVSVSIAVIQKKGDGETQKIIRLSFRLQVPVSHEVAKFAENSFGSDYWVTLEGTQEPLFDEEESEE